MAFALVVTWSKKLESQQRAALYCVIKFWVSPLAVNRDSYRTLKVIVKFFATGGCVPTRDSEVKISQCPLYGEPGPQY